MNDLGEFPLKANQCTVHEPHETSSTNLDILKTREKHNDRNMLGMQS